MEGVVKIIGAIFLGLLVLISAVSSLQLVWVSLVFLLVHWLEMCEVSKVSFY